MRCKGWVADALELPGGWCCCDVALKHPSSQHFLKRIEDLHGRVTRTHSKGDGYHSFPGRGVRVVAKGKKIRHESSGKDFACHHYHAILFVTAVATTLAPLFVPSPYHSPLPSPTRLSHHHNISLPSLIRHTYLTFTSLPLQPPLRFYHHFPDNLILIPMLISVCVYLC